MTEREKEYIAKCKKVKPFKTGSSLHVYSEDYQIGDEVVTLYWAIDQKIDDEPTVEIKSVKEYNYWSTIYGYPKL